jgi:hypothetical protein
MVEHQELCCSPGCCSRARMEQLHKREAGAIVKAHESTPHTPMHEAFVSLLLPTKEANWSAIFRSTSANYRHFVQYQST